MRIEHLHVSGFRSLHSMDWQPGPLNVLIGPNAGGKSNLLRLIEMISTSARAGLSRYVQSEGGMDSLVWDGSFDGIHVRMTTTSMPRDQNTLTYDLKLRRLGSGSLYSIEHERLADLTRMNQGLAAEPLKLLTRQPQNAVVFDSSEKKLIAPPEAVPDGETLLSQAVGPFAFNPRIDSYQKEVAAWTVYRDIQTGHESAMRRPAVTAADTRVAADGQNLISVLHTHYSSNRTFKRDVNDAMMAAFGPEFEELIFPPAADQRIQMRIRWRSLKREQSAADLSDGTLRFLFLLAVFASPNPAPLIALDEPETGLHPSMLPIVAEYASEASRKSQVIFTTHSPAFLDAFKTDPLPTVTTVISTEGKSQYRIESGDQLAYWLKSYSLGELFRSGQLEAQL